MNTMTPAQGKYLTSLLNDVTAKHAPAGNLFREVTRALWAEGNLTKESASAWIDSLKKWLAAPHPAPASTVVTKMGARTQPVPAPTRTLATTPAADRHAAMVARVGGNTPLTDSVREACVSVGVTQGQRRRTGSGVPTTGPNRTMALIGAMGVPSGEASDAPF